MCLIHAQKPPLNLRHLINKHPEACGVYYTTQTIASHTLNGCSKNFHQSSPNRFGCGGSQLRKQSGSPENDVKRWCCCFFSYLPTCKTFSTHPVSNSLMPRRKGSPSPVPNVPAAPAVAVVPVVDPAADAAAVVAGTAPDPALPVAATGASSPATRHWNDEYIHISFSFLGKDQYTIRRWTGSGIRSKRSSTLSKAHFSATAFAAQSKRDSGERYRALCTPHPCPSPGPGPRGAGRRQGLLLAGGTEKRGCGCCSLRPSAMVNDQHWRDGRCV